MHEINGEMMMEMRFKFFDSDVKNQLNIYSFPHKKVVKNSTAEIRVRPGPLHPPPCPRRPRVPHLGGSGRRGPEKGLPGISIQVFPH